MKMSQTPSQPSPLNTTSLSLSVTQTDRHRQSFVRRLVIVERFMRVV